MRFKLKTRQNLLNAICAVYPVANAPFGLRAYNVIISATAWTQLCYVTHLHKHWHCLWFKMCVRTLFCGVLSRKTFKRFINNLSNGGFCAFSRIRLKSNFLTAKLNHHMQVVFYSSMQTALCLNWMFL